MRFSAQKGSFAAISADCHIVGLFEGSKRLSGEAAALDKRTRGRVKPVLAQAEFTGKLGQVSLLAGTGKARIVVVGLGKKGKCDRAALLAAFAAAARAASDAKCKSAAAAIPEIGDTVAAASAIAEGCVLASYDEQLYQTGERKRPTRTLRQLSVGAGDEALAPLRAALQRGAAFGAGINFTRDLVNQPANQLTPKDMAKAAKGIAASSPLIRCTVWGEREMQKRKMGGILGVSRGSAEEAQFIQLEYKPRGTAHVPKVALVGKGLTFDTGGISIKPAQGMELMKFDMGGAAAVLGCFHMLAALQPSIHVLGFVGSAENMPGGKAIKPGDLLNMMSGMTVEVNNTDAEGRLVLADCLHHAKAQKPKFIVDAATLTGACMIALGESACGLMSEDEKLVEYIQSASKSCGERVWRLPLGDEHRKLMEGHVADLKNTGPREGGASTAAGFLSYFAEGARWAHLDIAGMVWAESAKPHQPKGATGYGAKLFYHIVEGAAKA